MFETLINFNNLVQVQLKDSKSFNLHVVSISSVGWRQQLSLNLRMLRQTYLLLQLQPGLIPRPQAAAQHKPLSFQGGNPIPSHTRYILYFVGQLWSLYIQRIRISLVILRISIRLGKAFWLTCSLRIQKDASTSSSTCKI